MCPNQLNFLAKIKKLFRARELATSSSTPISRSHTHVAHDISKKFKTLIADNELKNLKFMLTHRGRLPERVIQSGPRKTPLKSPQWEYASEREPILFAETKISTH